MGSMYKLIIYLIFPSLMIVSKVHGQQTNIANEAKIYSGSVTGFIEIEDDFYFVQERIGGNSLSENTIFKSSSDLDEIDRNFQLPFSLKSTHIISINNKLIAIGALSSDPISNESDSVVVYEFDLELNLLSVNTYTDWPFFAKTTVSFIRSSRVSDQIHLCATVRPGNQLRHVSLLYSNGTFEAVLNDTDPQLITSSVDIGKEILIRDSKTSKYDLVEDTSFVEIDVQVLDNIRYPVIFSNFNHEKQQFAAIGQVKGIADFNRGATLVVVDSNFNAVFQKSICWSNNSNEVTYPSWYGIGYTSDNDVWVSGTKGIQFVGDISSIDIPSELFFRQYDQNGLTTFDTTVTPLQYAIMEGTTVTNDGRVYVYGSFNDSGIVKGFILKIRDNDVDTSSVSISSQEDQFIISPNPTRDHISLSISYSELFIYDSGGKLCLTQVNTGLTESINVQLLSAGTYIVIIKTEDRLRFSKFQKY